MMRGDVPPFPSPPPVTLKLSKTHAGLAAQRGAYARYAPKARMACDECIAYLHENGGVGPPPRGALQTRRALGETLRLCTQHAELWRALDKATGARL